MNEPEEEPRARDGATPDEEQPFTKRVDDEWKRAAQAEKQRLAQRGRSPDLGGAAENLPEASLLTLISSLYQQAAMALSAPRGGGMGLDLAGAKFNIELLQMIKAKTEGNRTPDENRALEEVLYSCQMRYVEASRRSG